MSGPSRDVQAGDHEYFRQIREALNTVIGFLAVARNPIMTDDSRSRIEAEAYRDAVRIKNLVREHLLLIVARDRLDYYDQLRKIFSDSPHIEIVLDRRAGQRRRQDRGFPVERRRGDRRQKDITEALARSGLALARPARRRGAAPEGNDRGESKEAPPRSGLALPPSRPVAGPEGHDRSEIRHVLIVDDDREILTVLTAHFENYPDRYRVTAVADGEQALAAFATHRFDLILLDIRMPGMNGLEVLRRIRGSDRNIPVIMVTGGNWEEAAKALRQGAQAYITKPFRVKSVEDIVTLVMEKALSVPQ